jgi:hypothetical protein
MDIRFFLNRVKNLIIDPVKAWETIQSENRPIGHASNSFLYPLLVLGAVSAFLGTFLFSHSELRPVFFILTGIKYLLLMFITIYVTAVLLKEITKALDISCSFNVAYKLVIFSAAPLLLCQLLSRLFESFIFVNILALYGLYVFWTGIDIMLNTPQYKKLPMLIATGATFIGTFVISNWLLTKFIDRLYFAVFA